MKLFIDEINEVVKNAFEELGYERETGRVNVSNRPDLCQYQCNGALANAKKHKKAPMIIAQEVVEKLNDNKIFSKLEAVAPGFINMNINDEFLIEYVNKMNKDESFGVSKATEIKKIVVDYGGANVAKPLHIGHLRSAIIGESIKRIAKFLGHDVVGDVHLGDWGLQMGMVISEVERRNPSLPYFDENFNGEYPAYYINYLKELDIVPHMPEEDKAVLKKAKMDFIAFNYYRTLCARHVDATEENPKGSRGENEIDYDLYGYFKIEKNPNLKATEYGAQIDPVGMRIALNDYYNRYHLQLIITENGLGTADILTEEERVHDDYRINYLRDHIDACAKGIADGVELMGYCPWSVIDLLSSHQGFKKRYGFVYINRSDHDIKDLRRIKKDSFFWYQNVIKSNGQDL